MQDLMLSISCDEEIFMMVEKEICKEIERICIKHAFDVKRYMMFWDTCGMGWVLDKLAGDIYLSGIYTDEICRRKMALMKVVDEINTKYNNILFKLNERIKVLVTGSEYDKLIDDRKKIIKRILERLTI